MKKVKCKVCGALGGWHKIKCPNKKLADNTEKEQGDKND